MPQLIAVALIGGVIWYGYRAFKREMERVGRETREADLNAKKDDAMPLQKGEDGVYRPGDTDK